MKCLSCGANISALKLLNTRSKEISCDKCNVRMGVSGVWWFLVAPMLALFFFPFASLPENLFLSVPVVIATVVFAYYITFRVFVRVVIKE